MIQNPFPGPKPYREADRELFFGREELSFRLEGMILATRCVTVYGPSGAGKSSLLGASVLPKIVATREARVVRVDGWPPGEEPTRWFAQAMFEGLGFGELPGDMEPKEAVLHAAKRAARGSSRLVIVTLDQLEQLLYVSRSPAETEEFFEALEQFVELPVRALRVVLTLREDYLGLFRDRSRDRQRVVEHGFRVGPLTVHELADAVCLAAASGKPPQEWDRDAMRKLLLDVRVPGQAATDEAEAQSAYGQIVCRALFQARASGSEGEVADVVAIVRQYFEATLDGLGERREAALRLLEDHFVTADGSRTLRTERELERVLDAEDLAPILTALESAAILQASQHQGSRYFELGHDWLARRVYEGRKSREKQEEARRLEAARQKALEEERAAAAQRLEETRASRRRMLIIATCSAIFAAAALASALFVYRQRQRADKALAEETEAHQLAEGARRLAEEESLIAHDERVLASHLVAKSRGELSWAMLLLMEVRHPAGRQGWITYASEALQSNALRVTLRGHTGSLTSASFSPNGKRVLTSSTDGTARIWSVDGRGEPVVLDGHTQAVRRAIWSPDGERVLTISQDGRALVHSATSAIPYSIQPYGSKAGLVDAAFHPDPGSLLFAVASEDGTAHVHGTFEGGITFIGHTGPLTLVRFFPDGRHLLTASKDGTARVWEVRYDGEPYGKPVVLGGHGGPVLFATITPDGKRVVTTSSDGNVRVFSADGKGEPIVLRGHEGPVVHADVSPDGQFVATAGLEDHTARVFRLDGSGVPRVFRMHAAGVTYVSFRPDGKWLATASVDGTARVIPVDGQEAEPFTLQDHEAPLGSIVWSADGSMLVTTAADPTERSKDKTAKVWLAKRITRSRLKPPGGGGFYTVNVDMKTETLVGVFEDGTTRVTHFGDPKEIASLSGHEGWVASAVPSPTVDRVVTASFDKTARIFRVDGSAPPIVLRGHTAALRYASFSPDGERVVTASDDKTARIFRADGAGDPIVLRGHEDWVTYAAFSPDGTRVVTTSMDHTARIYRADGSGEPVVLSGHGGAIYMAAFDKDGKRVVTASEDGTTRVWNTDGSGQPVVLGAQSKPNMRVAWSDDWQEVATSMADGVIRIWNADGKGDPVLLEAGAPALAMAFQERGKELFTLDATQIARAWILDVNELKKRIREANNDCLPPTVRGLSLGEDDLTAHRAFELCESQYGRSPPPKEAPSTADTRQDGARKDDDEARSSERKLLPPLPRLSDLGPKARRVNVLVFPVDAAIDIGGVRTERRNGVVELVGNVGEVRAVRVTKGAAYADTTLTIEDEKEVIEIDMRSQLAGGKKQKADEAIPAVQRGH